MFSKWLLNELKMRDMSQADLAKQANVSRTAISNVLSETRSPGPDLLNAIAKAFRLPPEQVFRRAGLLPPVGQMQEIDERIANIVKTFGESEKEDLLKYARFLQEENPKYQTR